VDCFNGSAIEWIAVTIFYGSCETGIGYLCICSARNQEGNKQARFNKKVFHGVLLASKKPLSPKIQSLVIVTNRLSIINIVCI
jgi:hypothetical protein